jgi:hypothetical protein
MTLAEEKKKNELPRSFNWLSWQCPRRPAFSITGRAGSASLWGLCDDAQYVATGLQGVSLR